MSERFRPRADYDTFMMSVPENAVVIDGDKIVRVKDVAERNLASQARIEAQRKINIRRTPFDPRKQK
jgi:hypothetical protein